MDAVPVFHQRKATSVPRKATSLLMFDAHPCSQRAKIEKHPAIIRLDIVAVIRWTHEKVSTMALHTLSPLRDINGIIATYNLSHKL